MDDRIPEIIDRVDLAAEIERRAGPGRQSSGTLTFRCPHPDHDDRNPSFTVKDGRATCWSQCGWSGDIIDLVCWLDGCTKSDAIDRLAATIGLDRSRNIHTGRIAADRQLLADFARARSWVPDVLDELGIHVVDGGRGDRRIRFPFMRAGAIVHHQDRALGNAHPKWLSARGEIPCPYNADAMAAAARSGTVFIVEGIPDTVALLHEWPQAAVVGCPGAGVFKRQWAGAFRALDVFVIGDNDPAGHKFRDRITALLSPAARSLRQLHIPEDFGDLDEWRQHDPAAFADNFLELIDQAAAS